MQHPHTEQEQTRHDGSEPWLVLVVDDDPVIHAVTRLALRDFTFDGRPIRILEATSAAQARVLLKEQPDIAFVLLDIAMETSNAGLELVSHIREDLNNTTVRIALRTGLSAQAPAGEIVARYEIEDFREKGEMSFDRLRIATLTALRTYRLLQQMKQHQRELTASNEELERFSYVAAHDLQTPLRLIGGASDLLLRRYGSTLDPPARELLGLVTRGVKDMQELIRDLLDLSRIGRIDTALVPLDLGTVVDNVCVRIQPLLAERAVSVRCTGLPTVEGNASQLDQLFRNLIENAIKFQPGPEPSVRISADRYGAGWEIHVADRGIGIAPENLGEIFEVFRRLHTDEQFPGTGIGLAICKKIVEGHSGTIHAESTPGVGTVMVIRLPEKQKRY
ncbi:MAG: ATP-binding protein [Sinimarinibacterium sp.]